VVSPNSVASKVCGDEVKHALRHGKRFIPILRKEVPRELFDQEDAAHQAINAHNWLQFREQDDFADNFQKLINAISHNWEYTKQHTKLEIKAIDWYENSSKEAFLLRSEELQYWVTWLAESETKSPQPTELQRKYIKISLEVEVANQQATAILQKAVKAASQKTKIGLVILGMTLVTSVLSVLWIYVASEKKLAEAQADVERAKIQIAKAKDETDEASRQMAIARQIQDDAKQKITEAKNNVKQAQDDFASIKKEKQNEVSTFNIFSAQKVVEAQSESENGLVYIQVPSDAVKSRIQNLSTSLKSGGYKSWIGVVGKSLSPNVSQIRYFHRDQEGRVKKLKEDLIKINSEYKDFKLQYVPNFENKTKPEMMEIWFGKDSK
jgi:hypothetical protein